MEKFNVWYKKGKLEIVDIGVLEDTHEFMCVVYAPELDDVFQIMNGISSCPSPLENVNAQDYLINDSRVRHTSMSVGDVITTDDGKRHMVAIFGFDEV